MAQRTELLINVRSRAGSRTALARIETCARSIGIDIAKVHTITRKRPLDEIVEQVRQDPPGLLLVAAGDGTVSAVVNALIGTETELGVIPLGTTNNFARSLGMPLHIEQALGRIAETSGKAVDLGRVNDDYFANVAGIGLSAEVASRVSNASKRRWGRFAYAVTGIAQMVRHKPFLVTIEDPDRELSISLQTRQVIVANGRFHAGKEIAEDAGVANGQLVIFALGGRSMLNMLWHMADFYFGSRKRIAHASYFVGRHVQVTTEPAQRIELDGEVKQTVPADISVQPTVIRVRY